MSLKRLLLTGYKQRLRKQRMPFLRGFRSTAKLPMEFLVNTLFPFIKEYALFRFVMSCF